MVDPHVLPFPLGLWWLVCSSPWLTLSCFCFHWWVTLLCYPALSLGVLAFSFPWVVRPSCLPASALRSGCSCSIWVSLPQLLHSSQRTDNFGEYFLLPRAWRALGHHHLPKAPLSEDPEIPWLPMPLSIGWTHFCLLEVFVLMSEDLPSFPRFSSHFSPKSYLFLYMKKTFSKLP